MQIWQMAIICSVVFVARAIDRDGPCLVFAATWLLLAFASMWV